MKVVASNGLAWIYYILLHANIGSSAINGVPISRADLVDYSENPSLRGCGWRRSDEDRSQSCAPIQVSQPLCQPYYLSLVLDHAGWVRARIEAGPDLCVDNCPSALGQHWHVHLKGPNSAHVC